MIYDWVYKQRLFVYNIIIVFVTINCFGFLVQEAGMVLLPIDL